MLLPMLVIYQEYVRNHHFSLQVLAECKQKEVFSKMLKRLEEKPALQGRTLETFLTYPMHQVCVCPLAFASASLCCCSLADARRGCQAASSTFPRMQSPPLFCRRCC